MTSRARAAAVLSRCDAINRCAERIIHYTAIGSTDRFSRAELRGFLEVALSELARDSPASPGSGEGSYYMWVDQFNTLGVGENVRINTGN